MRNSGSGHLVNSIDRFTVIVFNETGYNRKLKTKERQMKNQLVKYNIDSWDLYSSYDGNLYCLRR